MVEDEKNIDQSPLSNEVFSLEDIDQLLEEDNPDFAASLKDIKADEEMSAANIESIDVDGLGKEDVEEDPNEDEEKLKFFKKIKIKIKSYALQIMKQLQARGLLLKDQVVAAFQKFIVYMQTGFPERLKFYKKKTAEFLLNVFEYIQKFKKLNWKQKAVLILFIPLIFSVLLLVQKSLTGGWLPSWDEPLLPNFFSVADKVYEYDPKVEVSDYYQTYPQNEFIVQMEKIVVNLRQHSRSGPNPMGSFEFFVAADAQETAIEIKDRQREFLDQIQRSLEAFSYEEASTTTGKNRMKEEIRKTLNQILNQGRVHAVYYNMFIIKP